MKVEIELSTSDIKQLIMDKIESKFNIELKETDISILVKTTQNSKSDWENWIFKVNVYVEI